MDDNRKQKKKKFPKKTSARNEKKGIRLQFLSCSSAFLGSFVSGLSSSWKRVYYNKHNSPDNKDYILYMPMVGDVVGLLVGALSVYIFGRRAALAIANILQFVPLAIAISKISQQWDFAAVILLQAAVRHQTVAIIVYTAEIAGPKQRGLLISLYVPLFVTGVMLSEYVLPTKTVLVVATALSMLAIMLDLNLVPETPYWLAFIDKPDEAEELFARLRDGTQFKEEAEATLDLAEMDADDLEDGLFWLLVGGEFLEPLAIVLCMNLATESTCQLVFAAHNTLNEYFRYETLMVRDLSRYIPQPTVVLVPIMGTLLMPLVVMSVNRRYIYFGSLVISSGLLITYMVSRNQDDSRHLMEQTCFFALHLGGRQIALLIPAEIFPGVIRPFGVAANELFQLLCHVADFYFLRSDYLSISPYLLIRTLFMIIGQLLCLRFLPETKDLTLVETEDLGSRVWSRVLLEEVGGGIETMDISR